MAKEIALRIQAKDDASANIKKVGDSVKSLGGVAKAAFAVFAAEKVISFFKDAVSAASAGDAGVKQSMQGITDAFTGFQVSLVKSITGNKAFMKALEDLLNIVGPLITSLVENLVPAITWVANLFTMIADPVSKLIGYLKSVAANFLVLINLLVGDFMPSGDGIVTLLKNILNGFIDMVAFIQTVYFKVIGTVIVYAKALISTFGVLWQVLKGDFSGAKEGWASIFTEIEEGMKKVNSLNVTATASAPANYRAVGAQSRQNANTAKNTKPNDPNKEADAEFQRLVKLRDQNALRAGELAILTTKEAAYRAELDKTNTSTERRVQILDLLKAAGEMQARQLAEQQKAMQDNKKANADLAASEADQLRAQKESMKSARDGVFGLVGMTAQDMSDYIGKTFGDGLYAGFATAFSAAASGNIGGAIKGFFAGISGAMGSAITQLGAETITKLAKDFIGRQVKLFISYGNIMKGLAKFLSNPWTAGFAAVAIGVALTGLSRSLGAQASGGVNGSPVFTSGIGNTTQIANAAGGTVNVYVDGGFINLNDPGQRQTLQDVYRDARGRNINIFSQ